MAAGGRALQKCESCGTSEQLPPCLGCPQAASSPIALQLSCTIDGKHGQTKMKENEDDDEEDGVEHDVATAFGTKVCITTAPITLQTIIVPCGTWQNKL